MTVATKPSCLCGRCSKCKKREYQRKWAAANPERVKEIARKSYKKNIHQRRADKRQYYYKDHEAMKEKERLRMIERSGGLVERECDGCGNTMTVTALRAAEHRVYCSRPCKDKGRNRETSELLRLGKPVRFCPECGAKLSPKMRSDAIYCSAECNSAAHHHTSKASWRIGERQERVSRAFIFGRDDYHCHICGKKFDARDLTLDHVVPLARGGSHHVSNLRPACLSCNCSKGARLLPVG